MTLLLENHLVPLSAICSSMHWFSFVNNVQSSMSNFLHPKGLQQGLLGIPFSKLEEVEESQNVLSWEEPQGPSSPTPMGPLPSIQTKTSSPRVTTYIFQSPPWCCDGISPWAELVLWGPISHRIIGFTDFAFFSLLNFPPTKDCFAKCSKKQRPSAHEFVHEIRKDPLGGRVKAWCQRIPSGELPKTFRAQPRLLHLL